MHVLKASSTAENTALFSLVGTTYSGDGRRTTALPNLEGRGPGLTSLKLGEKARSETVSLSKRRYQVMTTALKEQPLETLRQ